MAEQIELKLVQEDVFPPRRFPSPAPIPLAQSAKVPALAVKARAAILSPGIPAEDAFRLTVLQCLWHIAANIPAVLEARDAEGLHQMRVGFRRLRVAFTSFGPAFRNARMEDLRHRAKKLSEHLSPARDLDVFADELLSPAAKADGAVEPFQLLRERAKDARRTAWDFAITHVMSPALPGFMADINAAIEQRVWRMNRDDTTPFDAPAQQMAKEVLDHRLKSAKKRAKRLNRLSDEQRHELRIALKKLRYSGEFFASLYPKHNVAEFSHRLSQMQNSLGAVHDVVVARQTLARIAGQGGRVDASVSFAAGIVYGWHLDRASHNFHKSVKRWKTFADTEPFWRGATKH